MLRSLVPKLVFATALAAPALMGCADDDDFCSDDLDCNDGFICEITGEDDGICIEEALDELDE